MNVSSDFMMSASFCCFAAMSWSDGVVVPPLPFPSAVVPLVPAVRESGLGGIAVEEEEDKLPEGCVGVAAGEELGDAFEGEEPAEGSDNKEDIMQRLRTFHIV